MICIDDLNDWIGCMAGHPNTKTPNIDKLAAASTLFTNAHCQAPICGPSRASLMSGLLPSSTGIYGQIYDNNIRQAHPSTEKCTFMPEYFKKNGYKTMGIGKIFHTHAPDQAFEISGGRVKGFGPTPPKRVNWNRKGTATDWGAYPQHDHQMPDYQSAKWTIEKLKQDHQRPFFLTVGFLRPHVPWFVPQKWFDLHPIETIKNPPYLENDSDDLPEIAIKLSEMPMMPTTKWAIENKQWKNITQAYLACVSFVDHYVGEVLNALENSKYKNNTLVILWSDHGYHLGEKNRFAKHSIWERATRTPLIIKLPGQQKPQRCSKPVGLIDIYPTLLDLCNFDANPQNQGNSLLPLLQKPDRPWPHIAITTYGRNNHAIRSEHYRYIRYEDGSEELYDHRNDANEWHNLASNQKYLQIKEKLKAQLPKDNQPWSKESVYNINEYFTNQRKQNMTSETRNTN
ncbi:MAG: sulfatase [Phycisphaerae bacterium]|nr:sulfatase [Phycisphaerae bacterium]